METKDIILGLRNSAGLSQDELAEKVYVTRQAVSRWENGDTTPNTETLKCLSNLFGVSINTLLGSPDQLICQCCGMHMKDDDISREMDGSLNDRYCKWCYADGTHLYHDMDDLIEVCVKNMADEQLTPEQARAYLKKTLPRLDHWKHDRDSEEADRVRKFKRQLMDEINALHVAGMPEVRQLYALAGGCINLAYPLPNGQTVRLLDDEATYLGNQMDCESDGDRHFGIAANRDFILVSTYQGGGEAPELLVYKKRGSDTALQDE